MPRAGSRIGVIAAASLGAVFDLTTIPVLAQQLPEAERPLKPEKNPSGDIPDNQVFVQYSSPLGLDGHPQFGRRVLRFTSA